MLLEPVRPLESWSVCTFCCSSPSLLRLHLPRLRGDHVTTARAIVEAFEIISPDPPKSAVMTASEFDRLTDAEIDALPELPLVIAHCAPETKGVYLVP
jgi:hypothetical protein